MNGSTGCGFRSRQGSKLLVVREAILMFVCLNSFVMKVVSLAVYVNVAEDCVVGFLSGWGGSCGVDFWWRIGKVLLCISSSCWYSAGCSWYVFRRLYRNLTAACLFCVGWFEVYGIMVSVNVGFLYTEIFTFDGVLWIDMSR